MQHKPNSFLEAAVSEIENGKRVKVLIEGSSMLPFIVGGKDIVEIEPCTQITIGDVLLFFYKGHYIIHRLIVCNHGLFTFRGDANFKKSETITVEGILGRVVAIYKNGRTSATIPNRKVPLTNRLRALINLLKRM